MNVREKIEHKGVVTAIGNGTATVRLLGTGDGECQGCAIAGFCRKPVEVEAKVADASQLRAGSQVTVTAEASTRRRAMALLAGAPLLLLVGSLGLASWLGADDLAAGTISLAAMAVWYAVLYIFRNNLNNTIHFKVSEIRS